MPRSYPDRLAANATKRAAMPRSRSLAQNLKELLANSFNAGAAQIEITCEPVRSRRRDHRGYTITCQNNGSSCNDPEILRTIGSSTIELHPETRGRFGQGSLMSSLSVKTAEIRTSRHVRMISCYGPRGEAATTRKPF